MMFDDSRLRDPGYFRENRLDAHTDYAFYPSADNGSFFTPGIQSR